MGHRVLWLRMDDEPGPAPAAEAGRLENGDLVVDVDREAGAVTGITSKLTGREWLAPEGLRPVVLADPSDTWSHFVVRYEEPGQSLRLVDVTKAEAGPGRPLG